MALRTLLKDAWNENLESRILVVKNIPSNIGQEHLENYLEVVCQATVESCMYLTSCTAVIKFDKEIRDLPKCRVRVTEKKLNGVCVSLEALGMAEGVYIHCSSDANISEDLLTLYFESKTAGGIEDTVKKVSLHQFGSAIYGEVYISDRTAINSILCKQDHNFSGTCIEVQPLYSSVHLDLIEHQRSKQSDVKVLDPAPKPGRSIATHSSPQEHTSKHMAATSIIAQQRDTKAEQPRYISSTGASLKIFSEVEDLRADDELDGTADSSILEPDANLSDMHLYYHNSTVTADNELYGTDNDFFKSDANISDRHLYCPNSKANNNKHLFQARHRGQNSSQVKQVYTPNTAENRGSRQGSLLVPRQYTQTKELAYIDETVMSPAKVVMLFISGFAKQTAFLENEKTILDTAKGTVVIKATSAEKLAEIKRQMDTHLSRIREQSEKLSLELFEFLSQPCCQQCLHVRSKHDKVMVAFDVRGKHLICFGLSDSEVDKGLKFFKDTLTTLYISLQNNQEKCINGEEWNKLMASIEHNLSTVYTQSNEESLQIVIVSFMKNKALDIKKKIIQFLKDYTPKQTFRCVLNGAKAKYFRINLEDKLLNDARKKHMILQVVVENENPLRLSVEVQGDESAQKLLNSCIDQIGHEIIDIKSISTNDIEIWLMMKGLGSKNGEDFFRDFERMNTCFIDVTKDGQMILPTKRQSKPTAAYTSVQHSTSEMRNISSSPKHLISEQFSHPKMGAIAREEVDVQIAMAMSLSETEHKRQDDKLKRVAISNRDLTDDALSNYQRCVVSKPFLDVDAITQQLSQQQNVPLPPTHVFGRALSEVNIHPDIKDNHIVPDITEHTMKTVRMCHVNVRVVQGEIVKQHADILVNILNASQAMAESVISKAFVKAGGLELHQMFEMAKLGATTESIIKTKSGNLPCKHVLHVTLKKGPQFCEQMVSSVMKDILEECNASSSTSVAIPPLGVGRLYNYPAETVSKLMLKVTRQYLKNHIGAVHLKQISYVIYDVQTYLIFERALNKYNMKLPQADTNMCSAQQVQTVRRAQMLGTRSSSLQLPVNHKQQPFPAQLVPNDAACTPLPHKFTQNHDRARMEYGIGFYPSHLQPQPLTPFAMLSTNQNEKSDVHQPHFKKIHPSEIRNTSNNGETTEINKPIRYMRTSRFPPEKPISKLQVALFAESTSRCNDLKIALCQKIKEIFLYEECTNKRQKLSDKAKKDIISILVKNDIRSIKGNGKYILKGYRTSVEQVHKDILNIMLEEKDNSVKQRQKKTDIKRETDEFVKIMVADDPEVPSYWTCFHPGETIKTVIACTQTSGNRDHIRVELQSNNIFYHTIMQMVRNTFNLDRDKLGHGQDAFGLDKLRYSQLHVLKIERIENLFLYNKYAHERLSFFQKLLNQRKQRFAKLTDLLSNGSDILLNKYMKSTMDQDLYTEINECYLFHGTKEDNIDVICKHGLDPRMSNGRAMLGSGVYGAESVVKADQYTDDKTNRTGGQGHPKKMFLIRMILGDCFVCTDSNPHKYIRPPCTTCLMDNCKDHSHSGMFDSVIGDNKKLFREFVVYDGGQCYPEFLITYERR